MTNNEPHFGDEILLLDVISGKATGRFSKVNRFVSWDRELQMFEVIDKFGQTRIVAATENLRQWLEVDL